MPKTPLSKVTQHVIDFARKAQDHYERELPKRYPNYPLVDPEDEGLPPPPEEAKLQDYLAALPPETIYQLALLVHLGRSEVAADALAGHYEAIRRRVGDPPHAVDWLVGNIPVLADELTDALDELRKHHIEVDKVPVPRLKVRKR